MHESSLVIGIGALVAYRIQGGMPSLGSQKELRVPLVAEVGKVLKRKWKGKGRSEEGTSCFVYTKKCSVFSVWLQSCVG